jgi:hypothetical protein
MTDRQPSLDFSPRSNGTDTSNAAAEHIKPTVANVRQRVLAFIAATPSTCDEIEVALYLPHQTASARCNDLKRMGLIVDSEQRRPTRAGCKAAVWRAVSASDKAAE